MRKRCRMMVTVAMMTKTTPRTIDHPVPTRNEAIQVALVVMVMRAAWPIPDCFPFIFRLVLRPRIPFLGQPPPCDF
jgi:hypothetical protein